MTPYLAAMVEMFQKLTHEVDAVALIRIPAACLRESAAAIESLATENAAIRALMDIYNLGGWTDSLSLLERAERAEAERDALLQTLREIADADNMSIDGACAHARHTLRTVGKMGA